MNDRIALFENGLSMVIDIDESGDVRLLHFSLLPYESNDIADEQKQRWFRLVELQAAGEDQKAHHGSKYTGTLPGGRMRYADHADVRNASGRKLEIVMRDQSTGLKAISHWQFYDGLPAVRV